MYIKLLFALILAIPNSSHAGDEMHFGGNICEVMETNRDTPNICHYVAKNGPESSQKSVIKTCETFLEEFKKNPAEARKECEKVINRLTQFKDNITKLISSKAIAPEEQPETVSSELNDCATRFGGNDNCHSDPFMKNLTLKFSDLLKEIRPPSESLMVRQSDYSNDTCICLKSMIKDSAQYQADINKHKPEVIETLRKAVGKKLINEFAANLEDVNYFKTNHAGTKMLGSLEDIQSFQCTTSEEYAVNIRTKCAENNIPSEEIKKRLNNLLGGFGDFKDAPNLSEKFALLQQDILNIKVKSPKGSKKSEFFTRDAYDKYRYGRLRTQPEVNFVNTITEKLLADKDTGKIISDGIASGKSPAWAIFSLLKDKTNKDVKKILQKEIAKHNISPFYNDLSKALENKDPEALSDFIDSATDLALDMHPGLKALYKDKDLFIEARNSSKQKSMLKALEENPGLLQSHFKDRCKKIIENFTEAACVQDDAMIGLAKRGQLNLLLETSEPKIKIDPIVKDLMLCQINEDNDKNSIFKDTLFMKWDRLKLSNYWERKNSKEGEANDRFSVIGKALETGDGSVALAFAETSGISDAFSFKNQDFKTLAMNEKATDSESKSKSSELPNIMNSLTNIADNNHNEMDSRQASLINPNYSTPTQSQTAAQNATTNKNKDQVDPREILREFLTNDKNKADVDRHLANINTEDQRELIRLKEELATNKETMLRLMSEIEQNKMKKLSDDLERLENNYKKTTKSEVVEDGTTQVATNRESASHSTNTGGHTGQTDFPREVSSFATAGAQTSSAGNGSDTNHRSIASENNSQQHKSSGTPESNFSYREMSNGEILVISNKVHESGALRTEDFSEEVMAFVKLNQPDVKTLKKLMSSGLILKFNVRKNGIETQEEIKVDSSKLTADAVKYLQDEIAQKEFKEAQRSYSFNTLKHLLGIKAKNSVN